jgi:hypothetical protein
VPGSPSALIPVELAAGIAGDRAEALAVSVTEHVASSDAGLLPGSRVPGVTWVRCPGLVAFMRGIT